MTCLVVYALSISSNFLYGSITLFGSFPCWTIFTHGSLIKGELPSVFYLFHDKKQDAYRTLHFLWIKQDLKLGVQPIRANHGT